MSDKRDLVIRNRQRRWRVELSALRSIAGSFLETDMWLQEWQLGIHLVSARTMARLNARWLGHEGSTDVITFDHRADGRESLHGEIFISLDDAAMQSRLFGTSPASELVRYVVHGILHLQGYDDLDPASRRVMKREEERRMRSLEARFPLGKVLRGRRIVRRPAGDSGNRAARSSGKRPR